MRFLLATASSVLFSGPDVAGFGENVDFQPQTQSKFRFVISSAPRGKVSHGD
jgi:hypothetical protein